MEKIKMVPTQLLRRALFLFITCLFAISAMAADDPKEPERFNDWARQCQTPQGGDKEICFIFQRINAKENGKTILHLTIGYPPQQEDALMLVVLPLGVALVPGIQIKVDEKGNVVPAPYTVCLPDGCRVAIKLESGLVAAMKAGEKMYVAFANAQGKSFTLSVSLNGFTSAFNTLQK